MKIELAPEAVADLAALVEYLHERNPRAAATTAESICMRRFIPETKGILRSAGVPQ